MAANSLAQLDRDHLIHPVTNFREHEKVGVTVLKEGHGVWLRDIDGNELLDAFSGLWCVNVGYGQKSVVQVAMEQMEQLPYATGYFHFGSEPAIRLATQLVELSPASLSHVYFTQGGSDAIDSAIRYITNYYNALGKSEKKSFIALERGYHGSSSLGSGLTGLPAFHQNFDVPHSNQHHIPSPYPYRSDTPGDDASIIAASVAALKDKVSELGRDTVAAFFCEPVQGSGGVIVPPRGWLKAMSDACKELDILFVADEVITGFGRTGPLFACEAEGVEPDVMTVAKGLTSGYAAMGAMLFSDKIYNTIAEGAGNQSVVGHGSTYSAHPVSAAVASEVIRLYREEGILENGEKMGPLFADGLEALASHPLVGDARYRGMLGALELVAEKATKRQFPVELGLHKRVSELAYKNGVIFRAFNDGVLGFAPALCYTSDELDLMFQRVRLTLDQVMEQVDVRAALR